MSEIPTPTRLADVERFTPSVFQSYHRPMRRGTVLSKSPPDSQFPSATGLWGPHVNEADGTGIIPIGMALGSPTEERGSRGTAWQPQVETTVVAAKEDSQDEQQTKDGLSRSKSRKWGIFGRSKSRRVKNNDRAMDSPDQITSPSDTPTRGTPTSAASRGPRYTDLRDTNISPKTKSLGRSLTEPTGSESKWPPQGGSPQAKTQTTPDGTRAPNREPVSEGSNPTNQEPILDVEIPNITLDRYSVMFANLLERRSATSLLARRQVTQDKIRALREEVSNPGFQKEILQPGRKQSVDRDLPPIPSLRLEPLQATRKYQQSSRNRSNTSPAIMGTPSKETFTDSHMRDGEKGKSPHIVRLASVKGSKPAVGSGITTQGDRPQLRSKFHIQSPTHRHSGSKSTINSSFDLSENEIEEGGLSPPPARSHSHKKGNPSQSDPSPLTLQEATRSTVYTTSTPGVQGSLSSLSGEELDEDEDKAVQDAVEISIARQISVSREQRRMLGPLQMHPIEGRRIAETKSSTPRLVDPKLDPSSPSAGQRNSERVVLERI
ncbi:hypothetical protein MAC_06397 [Metarhizium acridum CQMa 102]|uniref:Uncharacterized protein n=1 Tax=Metarhizium acridum (strain CQMa 102) TaxID=655827 RepID=E9E949_METAQ|nr:uncharacterized protein MAC_06397 [Metarhizium acridum CQMa 102]EFY87553.1 hypothetical protein MAC_06397 [Metarhizium acridum CQMa 102]